ncbi:hypothetical protein EV138_2361 [Kribbella voronezhensis]|uniref:SH3 domain-containing protein n=1 Tax=Kribbella voronezhensis TaxID=2512212 RepID=A0A4R7T9Y5_9ACTN|nr:hypothetical protein [Kribbella voronezhensis]TDU88812.1 hypothetical protein EV138_2361 [Kribbella voronezhensis]
MKAITMLRTATAVLAVGAAAMLGVGPAQAATTASDSVSVSATSATVIYDCIWKTDYGIYLFRTPTSTTADYFVGKGVLITDLGCTGPVDGRHYTDCGGGSRWVHIDGTKHGWAALSCITFQRRVVRA